MARSFRPFAGAEGSGYFPRKGGAVNGVSPVSERCREAFLFGVLSRPPAPGAGDERIVSATERALADALGVTLEVDARAFIGTARGVASAFLESAQLDAVATDAV